MPLTPAVGSTLPQADSGHGETSAINTAIKRSSAEALKANSGHLHGPLAREVGGHELAEADPGHPSRAHHDHFTKDAVSILKFHGSYQQFDRDKQAEQKTRDWQMMLRLRSPAGRIPAPLFLALDDLCEAYGNSTLRATTRQAFQMHGVAKVDLPEVIGTIVRTMGSTLAACGDINRNVMAPAAPFHHGGYPAARQLAEDIADLLTPQAAEGSYLDIWVDGDHAYRIKPRASVRRVKQRQTEGAVFSGDPQEPLYGSTYLPRKFKVAVTVPGDNSVDLLTQDIGLVLFSDKAGRPTGCNVYVGGGMGRTHNKDETFARTADPLGWVDAAHVLDLVQAITALQRDHGDREQRRQARMKYLIHLRGVDWFRQELQRYFPHPLGRCRPEPPATLTDYLGWHRQGDGLWFVGLPLLCGRLAGDLKRGLRELVATYQLEIRLTPNQDLLLCNIGPHQRSSLRRALAQLGFEQPGTPRPLARHAIACPALPTCGLAITEAERLLPSVLDRLESLFQRLEIPRSILVRITGCPNGCARPYMAELGLVGSGVDQYQVWLGGSPGLTRLAKPQLERMPIADLETTLEPLLLAWKQEGGRRSFGDFVHQLDPSRLQDLLGVHA